MNLELIPAAMVCKAWADGASALSAACDASGGEITGDQLKMMCSRGERQLMRIARNGKTAGWGVVKIDQLPNVRALHICELHAPGADWPACFDQLKAIAVNAGCTEIRCSAGEAQTRLYKRFHAWESLYTTLRIKL